MLFACGKSLVVLAFTACYLSALVQGLVLNEEGLRGKRYTVNKDGVDHHVFEHEATGSKINVVKNSGICETTPGVNQYSGYFSVGTNMSMWFWFFESRNQPKTAPLALWLNGGPGCASMIGLFEENGPCQFYDNSSTPSLNPYSWNEYANMLYVDEPIGTGFSFGNDSVVGTVSAAPFVWKLLQAFFAYLPEYECRDFGLFTESYGGHYGPEFAHYFQSQNAAIAEGHLKHATPIDLVALGINNGWYDAKIQEREYINFSRYNSYYPLINDTIYTEYMAGYEATCLPAFKGCTATTGEDSGCYNASLACGNNDDAFGQYYPDFDSYDLRQSSASLYPPNTHSTYLTDPAVTKAIGAVSTYIECSEDVDIPFYYTGDSSRSFIPTLSLVVQSGISVLIWAGDADSACDWFGGFASANAIQYSGTSAFVAKPVVNYTVDGVVKGTYKNVGNLSWLRVFDSGHTVPYFQPELALQVFKQTLQKKPIHST